eukprot:jgi/Psemu1/32664/gm1.32664_g
MVKSGVFKRLKRKWEQPPTGVLSSKQRAAAVFGAAVFGAAAFGAVVFGAAGSQQQAVTFGAAYQQRIFNKNTAVTPGTLSRTALGFISPAWLKQDSKIRKEDNLWDFVAQGLDDSVKLLNPSAALSPANLTIGLNSTYPDAAHYDEEYDRLGELNMFTEIPETEYSTLVAIHGVAAEAIPTMNLFMIKKKDQHGIPVQVKIRIAVLQP